MKNYKLIGVICIAISAALFAIGVNETIHNSISQSYFLFMFSLAGFFGFGLARNSIMKEEAKNPEKNPSKPVVKPKLVKGKAKK
jgi:hypothetical protein